MSRESWTERFARVVTNWTGSTTAFVLALGIVVVWAATGPIFHYNETWQLVINTGTTIVTFLMVFLIQRTQNKDSRAIHLKLNELVAAMQGASNRLVNIEDISEEELCALHQHYAHLASLAAKGEATLQAGEPTTAYQQLQQALEYLNQDSGSGEYSTQNIWWIYHQICQTLNYTDEASQALQQAYNLVKAKADQIANPELRDSYLENVRVNAAIVAAVTKTEAAL